MNGAPNDHPPAANAASLPPAPEPPASGAPAPPVAASPTALRPKPTHMSGPVRQMLTVLLSLCLGLFLADAVVSLVDDSLILLFGTHLLTEIRGIFFLFALLLAAVIYGLMGLTPTIPKRFFLPLTLFSPAAALFVVPVLIYFYGWIQPVAWVISLCQVILGVSILFLLQGTFKVRWPLVPENRLQPRGFSWLNLSGFLLVNLCVLLPAAIAYLAICTALAVDHFSEGFLAVRPDGLIVQVRKYVRNDGKTIQLVPMSHIGEPDFYRKLSRSFPTNSIILMEGVTDDRNLLTNKITYKRMANSLGLAEQQKEFEPTRGEMVWADVDVEQFATNTIGFLNLVMLVHSKGVNADTVLQLMQYSPPAHFEEQLLDDLLGKRNRRVLEEMQSQLSQTEHIVVPWGVAHMPGIAKEIRKAGFRLEKTEEYVAIRFRSAGTKSKNAP